MIEFIDINKDLPYLIFKEKYDEAMAVDQNNIDAVAISSFNKKLNIVDSRFVNLKYVHKKEFIFFSNYNSPKSQAFKTHNQINALFFWSSINVQIRIMAKINKTSIKYNSEHFKKRSKDKNALAISSDQSSKITSYNHILKKYEKAKTKSNLFKCPDYWGGFAFIPYSFEFWEGHESRINKRILYTRIKDNWKKDILQP